MPTSRYVQTSNLRYHLLEAGNPNPGQEPVLLLHGYPQTSHMWRHQFPALEQDWHLYAPDTRGFGATDKPRERVSRDIQARDIVDLLDALDIERATSWPTTGAASSRPPWPSNIQSASPASR